VQLDALEKIGKGKIISTPRIVTVDNVKASIMQGTSEPFPKLTTEGTISTEYKDVVLSTDVTPHITPNGSVSMLVRVKKEDVLGTVNIGGSQVPRTSKIEGDTQVLVQNGETLVIGGIYKKTERNDTSGVPGLMKIPILGWLFKNRVTAETTTELMIFITPRIVENPKEQ
jgi:type IV pilus assembly protein PilQ